MKRYLLFAGANYYPHGGWHDLRGQFEDMTGATKALFKAFEVDSCIDWYHIVDTQTGKIVEEDNDAKN